MLKAVIPAQIMSISEGIDFIEKSLREYDFNSKYVHEAMLLSEESMVRLIQHAPASGTIHIHIKKQRGLASITLSAPGPDMTQDAESIEIGVDTDELDRNSESAIRGILMKAYQDKIHYTRKGKYNFMKITVGSPERVLAIHTVQALVIAAVVGLIFRYALPLNVKAVLDAYLFLPIQTMFVNFLMLVTAPAVFFSIVSAVARYASFSDPGKVSVKIIIGYVLTSVFAVFIGISAFAVITPGVPGELSALVGKSVTAQQTDFLKMLTDIIPTNIVNPFLENNVLQLIFVAIVCGIAMGRIGDYVSPLRMIFSAMDTLFSKIIGIVAKCVPIACFAATTSFMMTIDLHVLLSLAAMLGTLVAALVVIGLVYMLIVLAVGRVNPVMFLRKCMPIMHEAFLAGSSVGAIPKTVRTCKNSLGISPKICSFSIPFGAIVNVDGNCIYLAVAGLFIARICGVDFFGTQLIPIMITVFVLSLGAPIAPGTVNVCLTVLLGQMGVSLSAISIIIGINAIAEMMLAASNVIGDVAVSLAVAKSEDLLDTGVFNAKPRKR